MHAFEAWITWSHKLHPFSEKKKFFSHSYMRGFRHYQNMHMKAITNGLRRAINLGPLLLGVVLGGAVVPSSPVGAAQSTTGGWQFSNNGTSVLLDQCLVNPSNVSCPGQNGVW